MIHARTVSSRVIGREPQLEELREHLGTVRRGSGRVVFVAGEAGIGKTRLVGEFTARARRAEGVETVEGRCHDEFPMLRELTVVLAQVLLDLGDAPGVARAIDRYIERWRATESLVWCQDMFAAGAEVYLRVGREAQARELVAVLSDVLDRSPNPLGMALLADASASFGAGVGLWRGMGFVHQDARSRRLRAENLLRAGGPANREDARRELLAARQTFETLGAPLELELTDALVRRHRLLRRGPEERAGVTGGDPARRVEPAPTSSVAAAQLTTREREILRLVAQGLSNSEIATRLVLSEHTVHRHVANVLARLGLPSRAAAVAYAARHALL